MGTGPRLIGWEIVLSMRHQGLKATGEANRPRLPLMPRSCDRTAEGVTVAAVSITPARRPNPTRSLTRSVERTAAELLVGSNRKKLWMVGTIS